MPARAQRQNFVWWLGFNKISGLKYLTSKTALCTCYITKHAENALNKKIKKRVIKLIKKILINSRVI